MTHKKQSLSFIFIFEGLFFYNGIESSGIEWKGAPDVLKNTTGSPYEVGSAALICFPHHVAAHPEEVRTCHQEDDPQAQGGQVQAQAAAASH